MTFFAPTDSIRAFLQPSVFFPQEMPAFSIKLTEVYKDLAFNINLRELGVFDTSEYLTGQQFFDPVNAQQKRQAYRKVIPFSAALVAGLNTQAHGIAISTTFVFTHIYGTGKDAAGTRWVPFPQGGANTSMLEVTAANVELTVPAAYAGYSAIVVLEYLKN